MRRRAARDDFSAANLPGSRKQQYRFLCKTRLSLFFRIGGLSLLFALPFLAAYAFNNFALTPYAERSFSPEMYADFAATNDFVFSIVYSVCLLLYSVGLAGAMGIIKKVAWGKGVYFWHDFASGIKANVGGYLLTTFVFDVMLVLATLGRGLSSNLILSNLPFALLVLLTPMFFHVYVSLAYYKSPYLSHYGNALSLMTKKPLGTLAFMLFPIGIMSLDFIPFVLVDLAVYVLLFLVGVPFFLLGFTLFCLDGFDRYTNYKYFPNIYRKGLRDDFDEEYKKASLDKDANKQKKD